jgi:hypothetical protein
LIFGSDKFLLSNSDMAEQRADEEKRSSAPRNGECRVG